MIQKLLAKYLDDMRRIFLVMTAFGLAIGLAFPYAVDPFVTWNPNRELSFRLACLAAGFAVGTFCFFLVRITLYQRNLMLARAKREWETSFDALTEGVVLVDADGKISRVNRSFARMFEEKVEDLPGMPASELAKKRGWEEDCWLEHALKTGQKQTAESTNAGKMFEQTVDPVFDTAGRVIGCVGVLRDVTEDRKLREELIQSAKMAAVGRLVSGAAHELNNPLTGVTALAQLLLSKDLDDATRRDLEKIYSEGNRAAGIVTELLSFVRDSRSEPCLVDMNQILAQALDLKAFELEQGGISLEKKLSPDLPVVRVDPSLIMQALVNLIDNARDAIRDHGRGGRIIVETEQSAGRLRLHIIDDGPGIQPEVREHVFDPFFTTKDIGQGTGLGLSVCFGIVEEHGGRIWLADGEEGAHFVIELPAASQAAAA